MMKLLWSRIKMMVSKLAQQVWQVLWNFARLCVSSPTAVLILSLCLQSCWGRSWRTCWRSRFCPRTRSALGSRARTRVSREAAASPSSPSTSSSPGSRNRTTRLRKAPERRTQPPAAPPPPAPTSSWRQVALILLPSLSVFKCPGWGRDRLSYKRYLYQSCNRGRFLIGFLHVQLLIFFTVRCSRLILRRCLHRPVAIFYAWNLTAWVESKCFFFHLLISIFFLCRESEHGVGERLLRGRRPAGAVRARVSLILPLWYFPLSDFRPPGVFGLSGETRDGGRRRHYRSRRSRPSPRPHPGDSQTKCWQRNETLVLVVHRQELTHTHSHNHTHSLSLSLVLFACGADGLLYPVEFC